MEGPPKKIPKVRSIGGRDTPEHSLLLPWAVMYMSCIRHGMLQTIENTREKDATIIAPDDEEVEADDAQDEFASKRLCRWCMHHAHGSGTYVSFAMFTLSTSTEFAPAQWHSNTGSLNCPSCVVTIRVCSLLRHSAPRRPLRREQAPYEAACAAQATSGGSRRRTCC